MTSAFNKNKQKTRIQSKKSIYRSSMISKSYLCAKLIWITQVLALLLLAAPSLFAKTVISNEENHFINNTLIPITDAKLDLSTRVASYCNEIFQLDTAENFAKSMNGSYFQHNFEANGNEPPLDAAFLIRTMYNECIVVFQSTRPNTNDWSQNLDATTATAISRSNKKKQCTVLGGFYKAYDGASYHDDLEDAIDECMSQSSSKNSNTEEEDRNMNNNTSMKLILGGHSQGGAIALIASVVLEEYNPLVITFGQPPTFVKHQRNSSLIDSEGEDCAAVVPNENMWRYINTENQKMFDSSSIIFHMDYDPVPFTPSFTFRSVDDNATSGATENVGTIDESNDVILWGYHIGQTVFLPPGDTNGTGMTSTSVAYFDEWSKFPKQNIAIQHADVVDPDFIHSILNGDIEETIVSAHSVKTYLYKLQYLRDFGSNPTDDKGFEPSTICNYNEECQGKCIQSRCSNGNIDELCKNKDDCQPGLQCYYAMASWKNLEKTCRKQGRFLRN